MKRRLTITFDSSSAIKMTHDTSRIMGLDSMTFEGEFKIIEDKALARYVDVQLLDASEVSLNQAGIAWTYEDPFDDPLTVGEYVMVPFGWANGEYLAKVVRVGDEPTYKGSAPIKQVAARLHAEHGY